MPATDPDVLRTLALELRRHLAWQEENGATRLPHDPATYAALVRELGSEEGVVEAAAPSAEVPAAHARLTEAQAHGAAALAKVSEEHSEGPAAQARIVPPQSRDAAHEPVVEAQNQVTATHAPVSALHRDASAPQMRASAPQPHVSASVQASATQPRVPGGPNRVASAQPAALAGARTLEEIRSALGDCRRCKLCSGRQQIVFGVGNPRAELVFVGEGPGADEDAQGIPFVGKAGQLLTKMIEAMGFARDQVYICNVVKCRPPGNRNPEPDEIEACEPFLKAQLAAIQPKAIVALGKFAAQTLLRDGTSITRLRGNWREYEGIRLMPTFHPAYLLRTPAAKREAWEDLQQVMALFGKGKRA